MLKKGWKSWEISPASSPFYLSFRVTVQPRTVTISPKTSPYPPATIPERRRPDWPSTAYFSSNFSSRSDACFLSLPLLLFGSLLLLLLSLLCHFLCSLLHRFHLIIFNRFTHFHFLLFCLPLEYLAFQVSAKQLAD